MDSVLTQIFSNILELPIEQVADSLAYQDVQSWDSIGHIAIISAIESEFNITLNFDDIMNIRSVKDAREVVKRYL